jgi:mRNA interferase RelE/StbE
MAAAWIGRASRKNTLLYKVRIQPKAQKQLLALPAAVQIEIAGAIDHLAENPRPTGCKKLKSTDFWRIRIGRYRVIYQIDGKELTIIVVKIGSRQEDSYRAF